jgi:hypothetical protein
MVGLLLLAGTNPAWADSFSVTTAFACLGGEEGCPQQSVHEEGAGDQDESFKGWVNLTVENTGTEPWGDFHFEIFQVGSETVEDVHFIVTTPYEPTSSQSGLSWTVDNVVVGATLDLFFYSDPVDPGETATFNIYTDNTTDRVSFFGTAYYPTPIPEPTALLLVSTGLAGLAAAGRRRALH